MWEFVESFLVGFSIKQAPERITPKRKVDKRWYFVLHRHGLEVTTQPPRVLVSACIQLDLEYCTQMIGLCSITDELVHCLVPITSVSPFTESSVCYATGEAFKVIVGIKGYEGNPLTAALCGYVFEQYSIELLEKGGSFKCRELVHGNKKLKPDETTMDIPRSNKTVVDNVESNQTRNQLHVPKMTNYAAIDAWLELVNFK